MEKYHLFCQAPPIFATRSQNRIIGDLQMIIKTNFQFKCIEKSFVLMPKLSICNGLLKTLLQYFLAVRKRRIFKMRVIVTAKLHVNVLILTQKRYYCFALLLCCVQLALGQIIHVQVRKEICILKPTLKCISKLVLVLVFK